MARGWHRRCRDLPGVALVGEHIERLQAEMQRFKEKEEERARRVHEAELRADQRAKDEAIQRDGYDKDMATVNSGYCSMLLDRANQE